MKIKGFSWVGIASDDFSRTFAFFTEILGLSVATLGDDQAILAVAPGQHSKSSDATDEESRSIVIPRLRSKSKMSKPQRPR